MSAPQGIPSPTKKWHTDTYASISPSNPPLSMKGKKVVISGGGYGIGREVVLAYAEAGASEIAILGRKEGPLNETKQLAKEKFPETQVSVYIADISDPVPVKAAAEQFGTWDILVLNAGYMAKREVIDTADLGDWWNAFEVCHLPPSLERVLLTRYSTLRSTLRVCSYLCRHSYHSRARIQS